MSTWRRFLLCWPFRRSRPLVDEVVQVPVLRPARELKVEEPRVPVAVEAGERVAEAAPPPRAAVPDAQIGQHLWDSLRLSSLAPLRIGNLVGSQLSSPDYSEQTCLVARDDARTASRVDFPPFPWFLE